MGRLKRRENREQNSVMILFFLIGFLLGTILPNVLWKIKTGQEAAASLYFLTTFMDTGISGKEYLLEILKVRGSYLVLCVLCGFSIFGVPLSVVSSCISGLQTGAVLSVSVLQFGLTGGLVGLGFLMPQYLVYVPVWLMIMEEIYRKSREIWVKDGMLSVRFREYCLRTAVLSLAYFLGILLECYVNPMLVEKMTEVLKLF